METPTEMETLNTNEEDNKDEYMNELSGGISSMSVNQPNGDDRMNILNLLCRRKESKSVI